MPQNTRVLTSAPLVERIKSQLQHDVRRAHAAGVHPRLAVIHASPDPAADTYVRLKAAFGNAVGVPVGVVRPMPNQVTAAVQRLNGDEAVTGIIVQLPLPAPLHSRQATYEVLQAIAPHKDVDGLGRGAALAGQPLVTAGPLGIMELLQHYGVRLHGETVCVIGAGRTMGAPLVPLLQAAGARTEVFSLERPVEPEAGVVRSAAVVVVATNSPQPVLHSRHVGRGAVVIDADGVSVDQSVRDRPDVRYSPPKGGVGPLTVAALFQNVLQAAGRPEADQSRPMAA